MRPIATVSKRLCNTINYNEQYCIIMHLQTISPHKGFLFILILFLFVHSFLSCTFLSYNFSAFRLGIPKDYTSQKQIVFQGFAEVPTPFGNVKSVYFGYDRDGRYVTDMNGKKTHIDLIEFKQIISSGWKYNPFIIFIDDNFDGYADRLILDSNLDGSLDKYYNIKSKKLSMNKINFKEMNPWKNFRLPLFKI